MSTSKQDPEVSITKQLVEHLTKNESSGKKGDRRGVVPSVGFVDQVQAGDGTESLSKSILNVLNGGNGENNIERLAFETNPGANNTYASLFRNKLRLLPDHILKRIAIQDSLVAAIVNCRGSQIQAFGRPQPNRHSTGYKLVPNEGFSDKLSKENKELLRERIERAEKLISTCGNTKGVKLEDKLTFSQYLGISTRNAVVVGRLATEVISALDENTAEMAFHSFRPIDAGTIYKAAPYHASAQSLREEALYLLEHIKNKNFEPERFKQDEYAWIQVVEGIPRQAFTSEECRVHNFYPVSDIELDGYPLTPIDTAIADITTHINITTHNKLYFQTGRAARGMVIIKSEEVGDDVIQKLRHQFNASINSVANAWRMPVFGVGKDDDIVWTPIDSGSRDMEFQYLSDTNSRVILSAFAMSPEEIPGYAHLSRGTNSQALSEGNNEYKLEAHRDVGIRPLMSQMEDFINANILPLIDKELSKKCTFKFVGLDAETPEKEDIRLAQASTIHMTYDELLSVVEKEPVGMEYGGELPMNPAFQQILDKYMTVGEIKERFFGVKDASKDPGLQYMRDPFFFQFLEMQQQQQQMEAQAQQQAQQPQQGQSPPGGGEQPPTGPDQQQDEQAPQEDLSGSLDQIIDMLSKAEKDLPPSRRRLLQQQRKLVEHHVKSFELDLDDLTKDVMDVADKFMPKE